MKNFTLAIIGRPNVGKSTLFNRLAGKKLALVDNQPGVTRDWRSAAGRLYDLKFTIIDTAGLEEADENTIEAGMFQKTEMALKQADVVLFLIDGRAGTLPLDLHFAKWLRRSNKPVILGVNKVEGKRGEEGLYEAYALGITPTIPMSAEHGLGLSDLHDALTPYYEAFYEKIEAEAAAKRAAREAEFGADYEEGSLDEDDDGAKYWEGEELDEEDLRLIQLAIIGRPNAGKSTLLNALLGEDRVLTGPEPGVTRDAIYVDWSYKGRNFRLVDTAGMRKKAKVIDKVEKMAVGDALYAIRMAQVVILVVEPGKILDKQDLTIASQVIDEGRALVIALNKWDLVKNPKEELQRLSDRLQTSLTQVRGIPTVNISALRGRNLHKLLDAVLETYDMWNVRVPTGALNRWLVSMTNAHPPALVRGRPNRVRYMSQINTRPPTFATWCGHPKEMPDSYKRYLINGLRNDFGIAGVPIRMVFRGSKNPFVSDD